jgi:hypothetical protein
MRTTSLLSLALLVGSAIATSNGVETRALSRVETALSLNGAIGALVKRTNKDDDCDGTLLISAVH